MRKFLKILGVTILSVVGLVLIVAAVAIWVVFTPDRLTPIARNQAEKYISCEHEIGEVNLTFIKTFPQFGVHLTHILVKNPVQGAQSDTLLYLGELVAKIDAKALWENSEIIVDELWAKRLDANLFFGEDNISNLDIFSFEAATNTEEEQEVPSTFQLPLDSIDLEKAGFYEMNLSYVDSPSGMKGFVKAFNAEIGAKYKEGRASGKLSFNTDDIAAVMELDSSSVLHADISKIDADLDLAYHDNLADIDLKFKAPGVTVNLDGEDYLKDASLNLSAPVKANLQNMSFDLNDLRLLLNKIGIQLNGNVTMAENDDIITDLTLSLDKLWISDLLQMIPPSYSSLIDGVEVNGLIGLGGRVVGTLNDTLMPLVTANVTLEETNFSYTEIPLRFTDIAGNVDAYVDLNNEKSSYANVNSLFVRTGKSTVSAKGSVKEVLSDNMKLNLNARLDLLLAEFKDFLPEGISATGRVAGPINARLSMSQLERMDIEAMNITGSLDINDLIADVDTTIHVNTTGLKLDFTIPNDKPEVSLINAKISNCADLSVNMAGDINADLKGINLMAELSNIIADTTSMTAIVDVDLTDTNASMDNIAGVISQLTGNAQVKMDLVDTTAMPAVSGSFSMKSIHGNMDTISVNIDQPRLTFTIDGTPDDKGQLLASLNYSNSSLIANAGDYSVNTQAMTLTADVRQDSLADNILHQWNPNIALNLNEGHAFVPPINENVHIPTVLLSFNNDMLSISEGRFNFGNSDFSLKGHMSNLANFMSDEGLLEGEFDFTSEQTDVNYFMDLVSGMGVDEAVEIEYTDSINEIDESDIQTVNLEEADPFMVPMGVDLVLNTNIKRALVGKQVANNLGGKLYIKDGVLVLEEIGFVSEATRLQLSAIYKSLRKDHLYLGLNYHMLDIEISKLVEMIPDLDSILPMLKVFQGNGEFHLSAFTYLNANYDLKMSTLRGSASILGKDLVVLDNDIFKKIRRFSLMGKNTENRIDSINAEISVRRKNVDVYPLMLSMGRYQAILGGRHNLDMNYDYHLSLTESPLPFRLGMNVFTKPKKGLRVQLARCQYSPTYRPEKQYAFDASQRELREIIREALTANVVREEEEEEEEGEE